MVETKKIAKRRDFGSFCSQNHVFLHNIDGNRKLIILVEAKKTLKSVTVKNAKLQLTQQVKHIRDYHDLQV